MDAFNVTYFSYIIIILFQSGLGIYVFHNYTFIYYSHCYIHYIHIYIHTHTHIPKWFVLFAHTIVEYDGYLQMLFHWSL